MDKNIIIPCDACAHKGICMYETETRTYINNILTDPAPLKTRISLLEIKCEVMLPSTMIERRL